MSDYVEEHMLGGLPPHDVVKLPSEGRFYSHGLSSFKVGYLTARDENLILSNRENLIDELLRNKIYEKGINVKELLDCDIEAILIFLRNTSFGSDYEFKVVDPKTNKKFEAKLSLENITVIPPSIEPNADGLFDIKISTGDVLSCKILTKKDLDEISKIIDSYSNANIAPPTITTRLEKMIVKINNEENREKIIKFVNSNEFKISDSKHIQKTMDGAQPKLNLDRVVKSPSGELVDVKIRFGVDFFRPFF